MKFLGVEFAPLNVPMKRRMETLASAGSFVVIIFGRILAIILTIYLVVFTPWRWVVVPYLIWMCTVDAKTSATGGRRSKWVRSWTWWKYVNDYFPTKLERVARLDPAKNYLFCSFPHGLLAIGTFNAFASEAGGCRELFPFHTPHNLTLRQNFLFPFFRELVFAFGTCDSSAASISHLLGKPGGGNIAVLTVGGAAESFNSRPGNYTVVLRKRKGFVKLAIRNGSPLVPVISFGETDLYDQVVMPKGSLMRSFQEFVKKWTGLAPIIPIGRGIFQYTFGLLPKRRPLTILVGRPIEVEKIESPTQEQIDDLHSKFVEELTELFEDNKHRYIKNAEAIQLEIE